MRVKRHPTTGPGIPPITIEGVAKMRAGEMRRLLATPKSLEQKRLDDWITEYHEKGLP